MKRIIKKSTTTTEMIVDDNGKTFIIDRKHKVITSSQLVRDISGSEIENWTELDKIYRQEIAQEAEEWQKKNPFPQNKTE